MSDTAKPTDVLRSTPVVVAGIATVVVVLIWLLAFFLPQGSKLSKLDGQVQTLQQKVAQGHAKVAALQRDSLTEPALVAQLAKLKGYVPTAPNVYNYITTITTTVKASGAKLVNISTSAETALPATIKAAGSFYGIPVTLDVSGTYDQILKLITDIYSLPRLTIIPTLNISGGGPGTNRSTALTAALDIETFTTLPPPATVP